MAQIRNVTSEDIQVILTIPGVFPAGTQIEGFGAGTALVPENLDVAVATMGVDGKMSAGRKPDLCKVKVTLAADSLSCDSFEEWKGQQDAFGMLYYADMTVLYPGLGKLYSYQKGVLKTFKPAADAKNKLEDSEYEIHFESVSISRV